MFRGPRTCAILDGGKLTVVRVDESPVVTAIRDSDSVHAPPSRDSAGVIVDEILAALPTPRPRSLVIGLPLSWLDHAVVSIPPLARFDFLAFVARDVAKRTTIPVDDLSFATTADDAVRGRGQARGASHLVIAAMESPIEALVTGLARSGVRVEFVGSPSAAFVCAAIREQNADADPILGDEPTVSFEIRDSGFAVAVSTGTEIHQFRIVSVALPSDVSTLAQVVAEEVRRSTIFFREKHRGRDVKRIRLLGRVDGDAEELRGRVAESTGIATALVGSMTAQGDVIGEARALCRSAAQRKLDLLPKEGFDVRRSWLAAAPAAALVAVCCAGLVDVANRLDSSRIHSAESPLGFVSPELAASSGSERAEFVRRLDDFAAHRDALRSIAADRLDVPFLLGAVGSALDPRCRLTAASIDHPIEGGRFVRLEGQFVDCYWEFESRLATLATELRERTGLRFVVPTDELPIRGEQFQEFVLVTEAEVADESAGS